MRSWFDKVCVTVGEAEHRKLVEILFDEEQISPEHQPNGQWLEFVKIKFPIIIENIGLSLDDDAHIKTPRLLPNFKVRNM